MKQLCFPDPLEGQFANHYCRDAATASRWLRLFQCLSWFAAWKTVGVFRASRAVLAGIVYIQSVELAALLALLVDPLPHRHERWKIYRFVLSLVGQMYVAILVFPHAFDVRLSPVALALFFTFDQVRLCNAMKAYSCNAVYFVMMQTTAAVTRHGVEVATLARDFLVFVLGGFMLPTALSWYLERAARRTFLAKTSSGKCGSSNVQSWAPKSELQAGHSESAASRACCMKGPDLALRNGSTQAACQNSLVL